MNALEKAFKAIEDLGRKRCAERGESWEEMQARLHANRVAAGNTTQDAIVKQMQIAAKSMFAPKLVSNVSDEEWAERAYEFRCENAEHNYSRSDLEEHGHFTRTI